MNYAGAVNQNIEVSELVFEQILQAANILIESQIGLKRERTRMQLDLPRGFSKHGLIPAEGAYRRTIPSKGNRNSPTNSATRAGDNRIQSSQMLVLRGLFYLGHG
jgi:hypothetical protein